MHLRRTDKRTRSLSPQKLDFTPVTWKAGVRYRLMIPDSLS